MFNPYIPSNSSKWKVYFFWKKFSRRKVMCEGRVFCSFPSFTLQKYIRFKGKGNVYQFLCLCFGLSSAPRVFKKSMKIPTSDIWKLNMRLLIFLDDISIMASTKKELIQERGHFNISSSNFGFFDQQKQVCITSMPDFTVSSCGNKFQEMSVSFP